MSNHPQKSKSPEICPKHAKSPLKFACLSPYCNFFVPLCDLCLEDHKALHLSEYEDVHPAFRPITEIRQELSQILEKSTKSLEEMMEGTNALFKAKDETILNHINNELDEILVSIRDNFDQLKKKIKNTFEEKLRDINGEISKLYYDLRQALEFCIKYVNKPLALDSIKVLYTLDLPYQVAYKLERKTYLTEKKNNVRFEAEISKEYRDKFFAHFDQALNELVAYENSPYRRPQTLEMSGISYSAIPNKKKFLGVQNQKEESMFEISPFLEDNPNKRKWMFYFDENTKNFYYLDIVKSRSRAFEKISLNIPFSMYPNHRSVLANDGEIYVLGGYDGHICEANESDYRGLFRLDFQNKCLVPLEKMNTLRHSFGFCSVRNRLFVVGGANYREGSLIKCESFDLKSQKWTRNNFLNIRSMNHSLATYKETFIFKFGGLRKNFTNVKELSIDLFERYDIVLDLWEKMKLRDSNMISSPLQMTFYSGAVSINENTIFVFGGKNDKLEVIKQSYLISFQGRDAGNGGFSEKVDDNCFSINEVNSKNLCVAAYFTSQNVIFSGKNMYVNGIGIEKERKVLSFDQKQWRNFLN